MRVLAQVRARDKGASPSILRRRSLEAFYYAFGGSDVYLIVDLPDAVTAAAVSRAVNQSGAVQLKTIILMTAEEMDQAAKKTVAYRPPGK